MRRSERSLPHLTSIRSYFLVVLLIVIVGACMVDTHVSPAVAIRGIPNILRYLSGMWPVAWSKIPSLIGPLRESVEIAVVSIAWASIGALVLGLAGARNVSPWPWLYQGARLLLNTLRGIPSLLYALIFVSMVGLGPFPGVLGLALHCIGALGRYFAEAFESADTEPIEAAQVDGANRLQVIWYVLIPGVGHLLVGYILYYFEYCIRTSTLLGLVGAGGIGVPLLISLRLFRTKEVAAELLMILVVVFVLDRFSAMVRHRVLGVTGTL